MKCIGQILLDVIQRCNETSSICDKIHIDTHDVRFEKHGGLTVSLRGHKVADSAQKFRLGIFIQPGREGYVSEDVLYKDIVYELEMLLEGTV